MNNTRASMAYVVTLCAMVAAVSFSLCLVAQALTSRWIVSQLIAGLSSNDRDVQDRSVTTLRERNVNVVPQLLRLLQHPQPNVRQFAAFELAMDVPIDPQVIEAFQLMALDESEDADARGWAIGGLARVGEQPPGSMTNRDEPILRALCVALKCERSSVAATAANALGRFGQRAHGTVKELEIALRSRHEDVRISAAGAMIAIDLSTSDVVLPVLITGAKSHDPMIHDSALYCLGKLGSAAKRAAPDLERIATSEPELADAIGEILKKINSEPE